MYKLNFFVPLADKERVKQVLFDAGAGRYENYDCCSFETIGTVQFRPLDGANLAIGCVGVGYFYFNGSVSALTDILYAMNKNDIKALLAPLLLWPLFFMFLLPPRQIV